MFGVNDEVDEDLMRKRPLVKKDIISSRVRVPTDFLRSLTKSMLG